MLNDFTGADRASIACGYTDLRKGIDGLSAMVQQEFDLDPFTNTLFLFFPSLPRMSGWPLAKGDFIFDFPS